MRLEDEVRVCPARVKSLLASGPVQSLTGKGSLLGLTRTATSSLLHLGKRKLDCTINLRSSKRLNGGDMLNGYQTSDGSQRTCDEGSPGEGSPISTLANMGNTCYLNSVLYTLRFAPTFLHNLHHLVGDLGLVAAKLSQAKAKSSSLGRTVGSIAGPNSRSSSSKDLSSLGSASDLFSKSKVQLATEKLHDLYTALRSLECKDAADPYKPAQFLQAFNDVYAIFEENQQQDAHELLVYLLDIIRETSDLLAKQLEQQPVLQNGALPELPPPPPPNNSTGSPTLYIPWRRSWKRHRDVAAKKTLKEKTLRDAVVEEAQPDSEDAVPAPAGAKKKMGYNFVSEDFGGITLRRTKCLECESVTEIREPFYDICVSVPSDDASELANLTPSEVYKNFCLLIENLRGPNKYWCENCSRYNEARREVTYERLPNLLVLQLKRFSTTAAGTEKMNNYMPTPLTLACFCDQCCNLPEDSTIHTYQLYSVIMHLGTTLASGHYVAYTRVPDNLDDHSDCLRESVRQPTTGGSEKSMGFMKYLKPKSQSSGNIDGSKQAKVELRNGALNGPSGACKSSECCGVKLNKTMVDNALNSHSKEGGKGAKSAAGGDTRWWDTAAEELADVWLKCDDDVVQPMSSKQMQELLKQKRNETCTPYLLFYSKVGDGDIQ